MSGALEAIVEGYWQAAVERDWTAFGKLLDNDILYEVPQTRERVRGKEGYIDFNATFPGDWTLAVDSIVAGDRQAVSRVTFEVDGQSMTGISFFEFRDGLICRITDFWPEPYEPPARMTRHIERY